VPRPSPRYWHEVEQQQVAAEADEQT
jgi:hypothetical protein